MSKSQHMGERPLKCLHGLLATTTNALFLLSLRVPMSQIIDIKIHIHKQAPMTVSFLYHKVLPWVNDFFTLHMSAYIPGCH